MPSIAAHMVIAKLVSEQLNITNIDFIKGNLLPDIILKNDSHHKIEGKYFLIPDLDYFKNNLDLYNNLYLGYYTHLLLDKYFLEDYVPEKIKKLDVFKDKIIYNEYNIINYKLVKKFNLDVGYLKKILSDYQVYVDKDKLDYNLECLYNTDIGETKYLKFEEFSKFLYDVTDVISEEIKDYAGKSNKLFIRTR